MIDWLINVPDRFLVREKVYEEEITVSWTDKPFFRSWERLVNPFLRGDGSVYNPKDKKCYKADVNVGGLPSSTVSQPPAGSIQSCLCPLGVFCPMHGQTSLLGLTPHMPPWLVQPGLSPFGKPEASLSGAPEPIATEPPHSSERRRPPHLRTGGSLLREEPSNAPSGAYNLQGEGPTNATTGVYNVP